MINFLPYLKFIDDETEKTISMLKNWVNIGSGTENIEGLKKMAEELEKAFSPLGNLTTYHCLPAWKKIDSQGVFQEISLGKVLSIKKKRPQAPIQVLFVGHMDTVFPTSSPFRNWEQIDQKRIRGPGITDMKGGIAILYLGLKAFEQTPFAKNMGWEVFLNPDEEIGSVSSKTLLMKIASSYQFGLVFEPAFSDGAIVSERKGSANFTVVARGKAAHVGRDFHLGKSAIGALVKFLHYAEEIQTKIPQMTLNIGSISGGGPVNIVPNLASCRLNIRYNKVDDFEQICQYFKVLAETENIEIHLETARAPKPFDEKTAALYGRLKECATILDDTLDIRPSGGVSDGNVLAEMGLPNLDTLGAIGGNIHTNEEYILIDSIKLRAKLLALFLMKEASL